MKKILRKVGLLTVAMMMMLSSGVAYGSDAVAANKWLKKAPKDNLADPDEFTADTSRVQRHQTVYFAAFQTDDGDAGTGQIIVDGTVTACDTGGSVSERCITAPLFIASGNASLCYDGEVGGTGATGVLTKLHICSGPDGCTNNRSIRVNLPEGSSAGACWDPVLGISGSGTSPDTPGSLGGQWIYMEITTLPTTAGDTLLLWVTGQ